MAKIKRYYWDEDLDNESFAKFISFQNEISEGDSFEVWLSSEGGDCIIAEMLKEIFESYSEDNFQLVGCGRICSSALDLLVGVKCQKYLIPGTIGMAHTISRYATLDYKGKIKTKFSEDKKINNVYPLVDNMEKKMSEVLTPEEMRMYYDNEDIWLSTAEIEKLLT